MENNQVNSRVKQLFKIFLALSETKFVGDYDYNAEAILNEDLIKITSVVGGVSVMSKDSILKLLKMQCSLRYMPHHTFYAKFALAADDLFGHTYAIMK